MVAGLTLFQSNCWLMRGRLEVRLDVVKKLRNENFLGLEVDLLAVTVAERDGRRLAGWLSPLILEPAPVADDLVQALLALVIVPRPVAHDGSFPDLGGLGVLAAILVNLGERLVGLEGERAFRPFGDLCGKS